MSDVEGQHISVNVVIAYTSRSLFKLPKTDLLAGNSNSKHAEHKEKRGLREPTFASKEQNYFLDLQALQNITFTIIRCVV